MLPIPYCHHPGSGDKGNPRHEASCSCGAGQDVCPEALCCVRSLWPWETAPGGTGGCRGGAAAAQRCLVRPGPPAAALRTQPCQVSSSPGAPGGRAGGWRFRLGPNEVCINGGRQEIQCLNWMLASPASAHRPSMFRFFLFFFFLCALEEIGRAGPGESRRPLRPPSTLPLGAEALECRPLVPDESCAPAQQWPPARPPFPLRLSNLY